MNFHESNVDVHLGGAEYRGGIHLAQLAMVGEKITIRAKLYAFWISLGLRYPAP